VDNDGSKFLATCYLRPSRCPLPLVTNPPIARRKLQLILSSSGWLDQSSSSQPPEVLGPPPGTTALFTFHVENHNSKCMVVSLQSLSQNPRDSQTPHSPNHFPFHLSDLLSCPGVGLRHSHIRSSSVGTTRDHYQRAATGTCDSSSAATPACRTPSPTGTPSTQDPLPPVGACLRVKRLAFPTLLYSPQLQ